jgi:membrane protein YqaA with SNARE-associated domain
LIDVIIEYYGIAQEYLANNTFQEYGILGLFFNSLLSATAIPLPTEILTSALLMGGESKLNVSLALIIGSVIGGFVNYSLGFGGNKLFKFFRRNKEEKPMTEKDQKKSHRFLEKFGWAGIFFASWIPFFGDLILISSGAKRMNFKKFTLFMVSGKVFKTVAVVLGLGALLV